MNLSGRKAAKKKEDVLRSASIVISKKTYGRY